MHYSMIWTLTPYRVPTESSENNMLEKKKKGKKIASRIIKAFSLIWIFLRLNPDVKKIEQTPWPGRLKRARIACSWGVSLQTSRVKFHFYVYL